MSPRPGWSSPAPNGGARVHPGGDPGPAARAARRGREARRRPGLTVPRGDPHRHAGRSRIDAAPSSTAPRRGGRADRGRLGSPTWMVRSLSNPSCCRRPQAPVERHGQVDLHLPAGAGPHPVVVLVHGAPLPPGVEDPRDWLFYRGYGALLAEQGLVGAVLSYQVTDLAGLPATADDIAGMVEAVRADPRVDAQRVVLWFFSGGGLLSADWLRAAPSWLRGVALTYPLLVPLPGWEVDPRFLPIDALDAGATTPVVLTRAGQDSCPGADRHRGVPRRRSPGGPTGAAGGGTGRAARLRHAGPHRAVPRGRPGGPGRGGRPDPRRLTPVRRHRTGSADRPDVRFIPEFSRRTSRFVRGVPWSGPPPRRNRCGGRGVVSGIPPPLSRPRETAPEPRPRNAVAHRVGYTPSDARAGPPDRRAIPLTSPFPGDATLRASVVPPTQRSTPSCVPTSA